MPSRMPAHFHERRYACLHAGGEAYTGSQSRPRRRGPQSGNIQMKLAPLIIALAAAAGAIALTVVAPGHAAAPVPGAQPGR